jgi:hypothetical protein
VNNNRFVGSIRRLIQKFQKRISEGGGRIGQFKNRSFGAFVVEKNGWAISESGFLKLISAIDFDQKGGKRAVVQEFVISVKDLDFFGFVFLGSLERPGENGSENIAGRVDVCENGWIADDVGDQLGAWEGDGLDNF